MQVFFILCSVFFAVYQYINSKRLYRTHVRILLAEINVGNVRRLCYSNKVTQSHRTGECRHPNERRDACCTILIRYA